MLLQYTPTEDELAAAKLTHILCRKNNDLSTQEGLIASLVHDITNFKYEALLSKDVDAQEKAKTRDQSIRERLVLVEDKELQKKLTACYSPTAYMNARNVVSWGRYLHKTTRYTFLRWDGFSHKDACHLAGLYRQIGLISDLVTQQKINNRVIYSNDFYTAYRLIQEGLHWPGSGRISGVSVTPDLYDLISVLIDSYIDNKYSYTDFKVLFPTRTDSALVITNEGTSVEIIKIRNFMFMIVN